ncbi:hypothetical protein MRX96_027331 [Rhipicephalus microplus]
MTTCEEFGKEWCFLEYMDSIDFSSSLPLRTFATHLELNKCTMTTEGKYVYIARNPCDVCVSFYHMVTNMSISEYRNGTFEDFVDTIVSGNFGYGDYFEHVAAGYALRKNQMCSLSLMRNSKETLAKWR